MKKIIREAVRKSNTLDEVKDSLFNLFNILQAEGNKKIGYVSGTITSGGKVNIPNNIKRLSKFTNKIRNEHNYPVFSATDVFTDKLFARLDAAGFVNKDWMIFWRKILGNKNKFITDVFMTPGWKDSKGASDEHKIAKRMNITIHYLKSEL